MWRLIGIKPEIVQRSKPDCIGVRVLRNRFAVPGYRIGSLSHRPRRAAVTLVVEGTIICPAGLLRRRVEVDKAEVNSWSERHTERLNPAIKIFVVEGVFVVPKVLTKNGDFVTHKPDPIISRVWLYLIKCRACPSPFHDRRLHPGCRRHCSETERRGDTADAKLTVGDVVKHVALAGMRLTPGVFVRTEIGRFGKIFGALIHVLIQVVSLDPDAVRHAIMRVTGVIVGRVRKRACEWVNPGA